MDVEKARAELRKVLKCVGMTRTPPADIHGYWTRDKDSIARDVEAALRALDGDGAEEWKARELPHGCGKSEWTVFCGNRLMASGLTETEARRIARLPALERAAEEAKRAFDAYAMNECRPGQMSNWARLCGAMIALRNAREQEGQ